METIGLELLLHVLQYGSARSVKMTDMTELFRTKYLRETHC